MFNSDFNQQEVIRTNLKYFFQENYAAIEFFLSLWRVTQVWDDLVDGDKAITNDQISEAFRLALVEIPRNPFYVHHQHTLTPLVLNMILQWQDANVLERQSEHDKHLAFGLRAGILQIIPVCAYLIGGADWAAQQGPQMRRIYQEKLVDFMREMEQCQPEG